VARDSHYNNTPRFLILTQVYRQLDRNTNLHNLKSKTSIQKHVTAMCKGKDIILKSFMLHSFLALRYS